MRKTILDPTHERQWEQCQLVCPYVSVYRRALTERSYVVYASAKFDALALLCLRDGNQRPEFGSCDGS